jgi:hypothetical protein
MKKTNLLKWNFFTSLNTIQESEGFTLANKLSSKHLKFERHKMNVKLAAHTLSFSVADAIEFLEASMKLNQFQDSTGTVKFVRTILNSCNPSGQGFKQPL